MEPFWLKTDCCQGRGFHCCNKIIGTWRTLFTFIFYLFCLCCSSSVRLALHFFPRVSSCPISQVNCWSEVADVPPLQSFFSIDPQCLQVLEGVEVVVRDLLEVSPQQLNGGRELAYFEWREEGERARVSAYLYGSDNFYFYVGRKLSEVNIQTPRIKKCFSWVVETRSYCKYLQLCTKGGGGCDAKPHQHGLFQIHNIVSRWFPCRSIDASLLLKIYSSSRYLRSCRWTSSRWL